MSNETSLARFNHAIRVKSSALVRAKVSQRAGDLVVAQLELSFAIEANFAAEAIWDQLREVEW